MAAFSFDNLEADMPGACSDVVRVPNPEVGVSDVRVILCDDAKMVKGDEATGGIARLHCHEA